MIPVFLKIKKIVTPVVRGALKGFPMINGAVEAIRNRKGVKVEVTNESGEVVSGTVKPHDWKSIITQLAVSGTLIYLFMTGKLSKDSVMDLLSVLLGQGD